MKEVHKTNYIWGILRIAMGFIFLWAFFDKLLGLGFATTSEKAWLAGGSPTSGFLTNATKGPFKIIFQSLAGSSLVDWFFMMGLLLIGISLILGIAIKIASVSGGIMMFLMWLAVLPPTNNPFIDDHIIYIIIFLGFIFSNAGRYIGLGNWWQGLKFVKRNKWLA